MGDDIDIRAYDRTHVRDGFACGVERIDNYFDQNAWKEQKAHKIRVFCATLPDSQLVVGYYSLTFVVWTDEGIADALKPKFVKSGLAVPAIYLPKLGVRETHAGKGIGRLLVRDAFQRSLAIADNAAIGTLCLDAIDTEKADWYQGLGFEPFADGDLRMVMPLNVLRKAA